MWRLSITKAAMCKNNTTVCDVVARLKPGSASSWAPFPWPGANAKRSQASPSGWPLGCFQNGQSMSMCHRPISLSHVTRSIAFIEGVEVFVEKRTRCKRVQNISRAGRKRCWWRGFAHLWATINSIYVYNPYQWGLMLKEIGHGTHHDELERLVAALGTFVPRFIPMSLASPLLMG